MPNIYAHWRFGDKCIEKLPENLQHIINNNREIFDYGVHGPDIFFYFNCLKHNYVNQFGTDMHNIPFIDTLKKIKPLYDRMLEKDEALAYLIGFTAHFALDGYCHSYIERKEEATNEERSRASHGKIETQFDKYLLRKDGLNPFKTKVTNTLKPSKKIARVISKIFPTWDEDIIYKTLKDQKKYVALLKDTNACKRLLITSFVNMANVPYYKDLMYTTNEYPEIEDAMLRLDKLFDKALEHLPWLVDSLVSYLDKNVALDPFFKHDFSVRKDYKNIPILSLDSEKNYIVDILD